MFCSECGYKLPSDTMKFCPECGAKVVIAVRETEKTDMHTEHTPPMLKPGIPMPVTPSFAKPQQEEVVVPRQTVGNAAPGDASPKKKGAGKQILIGFGLLTLAEFIAMALSGILFGMEEGTEEKYLSFMFIYMGPIFVALIGIWKKKSGLIGKGVIALVVLLAMTIGAMNDFPEVIRQIQGEDFVGIWIGILVAALVIGVFVSIRRPISFGISLTEEIKTKPWSDSDIMWLSGFDNYRLVGYYLLKAKLHKILVFRVAEGEQNYTYVEINRALGEQQLALYCEKNPLVKQIVEYIKKAEASDRPVVRVEDIVRNVTVRAKEKSQGRIFWEERLAKWREAVKKADRIFWWFVLAAYYVGVTKLMLGICREKPVTDLFAMMMVFGAISIGVAYGIKESRRKKWTTAIFIGRIVIHKRGEIRNIDELFRNTDFEVDMSEEEQNHLLRAYALYEYNRERYEGMSPTVPHFSTMLLGTVVSVQVAVAAAEAAARAAARAADTSGGCSSCSSCSSCGGCGGGCGGCGD